MKNNKKKLIIFSIVLFLVWVVLAYVQFRFGPFLKNKRLGVVLVEKEVSSLECTISVKTKAKDGTEGLYIGDLYAIEKLTVWGWKELTYIQGKGYFYGRPRIPLDVAKEQQMYVNWTQNYGELNEGTYRMKLFIHKEENEMRKVDECYLIFRVDERSGVPWVPGE